MLRHNAGTLSQREMRRSAAASAIRGLLSAAFLRREYDRWGKVIREAGIKAE